MWTVFDNHVSATFFTDYIRYFVLDFYLFQFFFRFFHGCIQIRIEIFNNRLPSDFSFRNTVQKTFHICCKTDIHNTWEWMHHYIINNFSKFCHIKVFIFLRNVSSIYNQCNCRCISTWASDSQLLQSLYKRRLCVVSRRLCKMLLTVKLFQRKFTVLIQSL